MHSIENKNPFKLGEEYFCECPECKETRKISKNTYYAMNRKAKPVSKRCMRCFGLDKRIDKEYKLQCDSCKESFNVSSGQMVRYRKTKKYSCRPCENIRLGESAKTTQFRKGSIPWNKNKGSRTKEDIRLYKLKWKYDNYEKVQENWKNYYINNYESIALNSKLSSHNRRQKLRGSKLTQDKYYLLICSTDKCACCNISLIDNKFEIDHIVPIKNGGTNDISNLQLLCVSCNRKKHTKSMEQFLQEQNFLSTI